MTNINPPSPENNFHRRIRWAIFFIQLVLVIFFLLVILGRTELGPTLDDSWIHYQFARNLVEYGEISFNQGTWSTGTTSLLWDLILALGILIGIPTLHFSIVVGIILYLIIGQQIYSVFRTYLWENKWSPVIAVLLVILSGNLLWFSLSGMETMLLLVLGFCWIFAFNRGKYVLAGLLAGALMLTRIEGMLFLLMGIFFAFRRGGILEGFKKSLAQIVFSLPVFAPSILLNIFVYGKFYPTTMAGKKWLYGLDPGFFNLSLGRIYHYLVSWGGTLFQTCWLPEMMDRPSTIQYPLIKLISGGKVDKVAPSFSIEPYPIALQLLAVILALILLIILLRGLYKVLKPAVTDIFSKGGLNPWHYLIAWFLGHNLIYIIIMPLRGHGGRYQAVNFILLGLFLIAGTEFSNARKQTAYVFKRYILKGFIILIYIFALITWSDIYAATVDHVNRVHKAAGEWLHDNLPANTVIAVFDVGAVKYFSGLPVVDIAGLTDREALKYVLKGDILPYMREKNSQYLVMIEEQLPIKQIEAGKTQPFHSSYYRKLGIIRQVGKTVNLIPIERFEISMEEWWRHWIVVRTHSPVVAIYKIEWLEQKTGELN